MNIGEDFATIDAAIVEAKRLTKIPKGGMAEYLSVVVRDGASTRLQSARLRVRSQEGRAWWLVPCKACKGSGGTAAVHPSFFGGVGPTETCKFCSGIGAADDLPCG